MCKHLREFVDVEISVIKRHLNDHKWFNHIDDENDAVKDFIDKYGWLMREMYCKHICEDKEDCDCSEDLFNNKNYKK